MDFTPLLPFEPVTAKQLPQGDEWVAQIKFDGVRMLTYGTNQSVELWNRRQHERTHHYPELLRLGEYCRAQSVILDGEIVAFVDEKPSFYQVMKRDGIRDLKRVQRVREQVPIAYMVFDILHVDGRDTTGLPLNARQKLLQDVMLPHETVHLVDNFEDGDGLFRAVQTHGLEGVVVKNLTSTYVVNGKDTRWQKKKCTKDTVAVVGGVTHRDGVVNALLLGLYDASGAFTYVGKAGSGRLTSSDWRDITIATETIRASHAPFSNPPQVSNVTWLVPRLTVKVEFLEWVDGHSMRHPVIQAFVNAHPQSCRLEHHL